MERASWCWASGVLTHFKPWLIPTEYALWSLETNLKDIGVSISHVKDLKLTLQVQWEKMGVELTKRLVKSMKRNHVKRSSASNRNMADIVTFFFLKKETIPSKDWAPFFYFHLVIPCWFWHMLFGNKLNSKTIKHFGERPYWGSSLKADYI